MSDARKIWHELQFATAVFQDGNTVIIKFDDNKVASAFYEKVVLAGDEAQKGYQDDR